MSITENDYCKWYNQSEEKQVDNISHSVGCVFFPVHGATERKTDFE